MAEVETERRRAPRHLATIPLRMRAHERSLDASTVNVSRGGVLVRMSFEALDCRATDDPTDVMQRVADLLGDLVVADFDPDQLGSLVRKSLRLVRISLPGTPPGTIEVGCALRDPLSEEELIILGLPAAAEDETVPVPEPVPPEALGETLTALLCGADGRPTRPLAGIVETVSAEGVRLEIPSEAREGLLPARATVSNVLGNLRVRYGSRPTLVLLKAGRPIWSVAAGVAEAVVNRRTGRVDLELRFAEPPEEGIGARLGLAGARDPGRARPPDAGREADLPA